MVMLKKVRKKHKIAHGAEAVIMKDGPNLLKERVKKSYRNEQLDDSLRKFRTKREVKILENLAKSGLSVPNVIDKKTYSFVMENLEGKKIRDILDGQPQLAKSIGQIIARMHNLDIVHGDLTTSNMILFKDNVHLIDFGLSAFSSKVEDKAVDIHLFKQALESKHHKVYYKALQLFLKGYKPHNRREILKQLDTVESRGRYKQKY